MIWISAFHPDADFCENSFTSSDTSLRHLLLVKWPEIGQGVPKLLGCKADADKNTESAVMPNLLP